MGRISLDFDGETWLAVRMDFYDGQLVLDFAFMIDNGPAIGLACVHCDRPTVNWVQQLLPEAFECDPVSEVNLGNDWVSRRADCSLEGRRTKARPNCPRKETHIEEIFLRRLLPLVGFA